MLMTRMGKVSLWTGLVGCGVLLATVTSGARAAETKGDNKTAQKDGQAPPAKAKKLSGRLPQYYASVVTPEQRKQIYEVQAQYQPKIDALHAQLTQLTKELGRRWKPCSRLSRSRSWPS